jgi:hypothetical protein
MDLTHVDRMVDYDASGKAIVRSVRSDPGLHTLDLAARLLHLSLRTLERDPAQNIRGGAALLARYARQTTGRRPGRLADWYGAVARFSGSPYLPVAREFADAVYHTMETGAERVTADGQRVVLLPQQVSANTRTIEALRLRRVSGKKALCPPGLACRYVPAAYQENNPRNPQDYGNYDAAHRPRDLAIRYVVIHDTEGSYNSAITSFQNPTRYASANYVIRSSDGLVTQMVPTGDIAWHAGNYDINMHAIGIEHEGIAVKGATWYTEEMYESSAALVRYLAQKYHIPLDREHIVGHDQVPGESPDAQAAQHWDPGPFWDWQHYMDLLRAPDTGDEPLPQPVTAPLIMTIDPPFAFNQPFVTFCTNGTSCSPLPAQSANFVYLRTAPSPSAPLFGDAALHSSITAGTNHADDWGDKAVTGEQFVCVARSGDWDAIDYSGHRVWLYDSPDDPAASLSFGTMISARGNHPIPVYGDAYPEARAYPRYIPQHERAKIFKLQYTIPPGQHYVTTGRVTSDFYWSPTQKQHAVVRGKTAYYQISFDHRFAFVRASDVRVTTITPPTPTPTPTPSPSPTATPTPSPVTAVTVTPTWSVTPMPEVTPSPTTSAADR